MENQRPYQSLARLFGLKTPLEEILYLPGEFDDDKLLQHFISDDSKKIEIIAPASLSPRKMIEQLIWQNIAEKLKN